MANRQIVPYAFKMSVVDNHLHLTGGYATRWGGKDDEEDNHETASGFNMITHPDELCISLPIASSAGNLYDSPLGKIPWLTKVAVINRSSSRLRHAILVDVGPARATGRVADLSNSLVRSLGLKQSTGIYPVNVIIPGADTFLSSFALRRLKGENEYLPGLQMAMLIVNSRRGII